VPSDTELYFIVMSQGKVEKLWPRWQMDVICTFVISPQRVYLLSNVEILFDENFFFVQKLGRYVPYMGLYIWS